MAAENNMFYVAPANPLAALMQGVSGYDRANKAAKEAEQQAAFREVGQQIQSGGGINSSALGKLFGLGPSAAPMITAAATLGKADTTDEIKEYNLAKQQGFKGSLVDYKTALKKAGATQVNVNQHGERAYESEVNKDYAKEFIGLQKTGRNALTTIGTLNRMETLTANPNFYSGTGSETVVLPFKRMVASLGGDPNAANAMEEFRALSNKSALDGMGGSLGTGFSNADRDFIVNQYPALENTPEGNKQRIDGLRKIEQRKIEISRIAREYARQRGRLDAGFDEALAAWAEKNPLFPRTAPPRQQPAASGPSNIPPPPPGFQIVQ